MRPRPRPLSVVALLALGACGEDAAPPATPPRPAAVAPAGPRPVGGPRTPEGGPNAARERIGPYPRREFVIAHDAFLAADEPRTVPAADARFLREADEVLGVVVGTQARAYLVAMLAYHHVVNDVMAGTPVAVTY